MNKISIVLCWCAAALCASCGGGGSSHVPSTAASCQLPLQYANGESSGIRISPVADSVERSFNNCDLAQVRTVTVTVCIDHLDVSELSGELKLSGERISPFRVQDGIHMANTCLASGNASTSLRQYKLALPDNLTLSQARGPWKITLTDGLPSQQTGFFVAWDLKLEGLQ